MGRIELIGHRGAPNECVENTVEAFERAFARGADAIELDVHSAADGTVVVHHDATLTPHVIPSTLRGRRIAEMTWEELQTVRLRSQSSAQIPTLAEVLRVVPEGATAYVELKGLWIEERVAPVIRSSGRRCAVHSFNHEAVRRIRSIAPDIRRGLLFDQYPNELAAALRTAGASDIWLERRLIDRAIVQEAHTLTGRVYAWTVNDPKDAQHLAELGVDALCSDDVRPLSYLR